MEVDQQFDQKPKLIPSTQEDAVRDNTKGSFECNICLETANDSVVTLCGHLYCWPCIYKWLDIQSASLPSDEYPLCPVCKAEISNTTLIPLYGRGSCTSNLEDESNSTFPDLVIPPRPTACGTHALLDAASQPENQLHPYRRNSSPSLFNQMSNAITNVLQPAVGMFGEMVYARVFGSHRNSYTYPNSNHYLGNSSFMLRRQEIQVDKSLNRISLLLLCCFTLCLFLF